MATTTEALEAAHARLELEALIDELTLERKERLDDGRHASRMPLLAAVYDARTARDRAGSCGMPSQASPAHLSATELLADVDRTVGALGRTRTRAGAVRAWAAAAYAGDLGTLMAAVDAANRWSAVARSLLEPRRTLALRGAVCPSCGARDVVGDGNAGERVVNPALVVDMRAASVSCTADGCGETWPWEQLHLLADQLDRQACETLAVE